MVHYIPWGEDVLNRCISRQREGKLPALDLELTAQCTGACCIYCDSKPTVGKAHCDELTWELLHSLLTQCKEQGLEWVYTCGLGEPLEDGNFWRMVEFLKANNIRLSMFSNGIFIKDLATAKRLKEAGVCIILKMDTFDEDKFDIILGAKDGVKGRAKKIYAARDLLLEAGYARDKKGSDLAFSIVPTSLAIDGIPEVIDFCEKNRIFASIGELEQAGEVMKGNTLLELGLQSGQIDQLKMRANAYASPLCYMRPICPSILTGFHIDHIGQCLVDRITGLNCKWFLLTEPDVKIIGNIRTESVKRLYDKVIAYRSKSFVDNKAVIDGYLNISYVFGGCGGNPKNIVELTRKSL